MNSILLRPHCVGAAAKETRTVQVAKPPRLLFFVSLRFPLKQQGVTLDTVTMGLL